MKIKKYILLFAILGLAVLAFSAISHNVSATDQHLDQDGWEFHYDSTSPAILTNVIQTGTNTEINIPVTLDGSTPLTIINSNCFHDSEGAKITKVLSMKSITFMGANSFFGCINLNSIILPDGLTFIGTESFEGCTSLTSIIIPNTVTELGYAIFYHTTALKYVTIGSEVDTIGALLFAGDTSLISINFTSLIMPLTVDSSWISGCIAPQGHAYQNSIFPIPGQLFNGLLMGSNIPEPIVPVTGTVSGTSWYVLVIALAIVGLMTYAGMRDHNFMLLSGICWSSVSYIVIIPLSMPLAMIGVVIGLLLCLWGVYKLVIA